MIRDDFAQFIQRVRTLTGIDLTAYKRPQMERRLTSLRNKHGFPDFNSYLSALYANPRLREEFMDRITINVSEFFRNPDRWVDLAAVLRTQTGPVRAWSAACAQGEEPYTLAMVMETEVRRPYNILATDIDPRALAQARQRRFRTQQVQSVPETYRRRYFTQYGDEWELHASLARHVRFERHDLLRDPYPSSLDLIICRNVLIYFTQQAKHRVVSQFVQALKPGGILFVGSTEQFLEAHRYALRPVAPFIYQKVARE
jgi:chemotaxis protein methyltransferase CheR